MSTSFLSALSSGNLDTLRGTTSLAPRFTGRVRVSANPNTVIYSMRVNQSVFAASYAQITFDGGSGTLADIWAGMTVLIAHTNDVKASYYSGRVRKTPSSTILYVNESSIRISDNDYIFVINDHRIADKLGRGNPGLQYMDYDISPRQLLPVIYNLRSAYVADIASSIITLSFAPLALAATSGATISTWAWSVGDGTITVGSSSTQDITATFPEGFRYIHLTVTDSGGRSSVRHIPIFAHGATFTPALIASGILQTTHAVASGVDATLSAFAGVSSLLDNTLVVFSSDDTYQDASSSITGDNIIGIFRVRKSTDAIRTDPDAGLDTDRALTLESPLTQLGRLNELAYEMLNKASPSAWGEIKNATLWRVIVFILSEATTFLELHSLSFDDTSDTFLAPTHNVTGSILESINDLAKSINAALQMNGAGQVEIVRAAYMLTDSERNALVTVATWGASDLLEVSGYDHDQIRPVGRLDATGGRYNSATDLYLPFRSRAPGVAQESGSGTEALDAQILAANQTDANAQIELNTRAGHAYEFAQTPDELTVIFADGHYAVLIPSLNMWHCFSLSAQDTFPAVDSSVRWLLDNVQTAHNSDGTKTVTAHFIIETKGAPGQTITQPVATGTPSPTPITLPFDPFPAFPTDPGFVMPPIGAPPLIPGTDGVPRADGNTIATSDGSDLWLVRNFINSTVPDYPSIHPEPGASIYAFLWYPYSVNNRGAYALIGDGSTSAIYSTVDAFAKPPVWVAGAAMDGIWGRLRAVPELPGAVYAAHTKVGDPTPASRTWISDSGTIINRTDTYIDIEAADHGSFWEATLISAGGIDDCCDSYSSTVLSGTVTSQAIVHCGLARISGNLDFAFSGSPSANLFDSIGPGAFTIRVTLNCTSASADTAESSYSTDYGVTMASPVTIAATPLNGFDVSKKGAQVLAGADVQVMLATAGGSYAAFGDPAGTNAVLIPRFQFGSTTVGNTSSTPQYLAATVLDGGGANALVKVFPSGGGSTITDITPTVSGDAGYVTASECLSMSWINGGCIVAILNFGGVPRLVATTNSGTTWHASGFLNTTANYVRQRKNDLKRKQAFFNNMGPAYTPNIQATTPAIYTRSYPTSDPIILIEPFGG